MTNSTCTTARQKQANDYTSSQHRIPSSEQPASKRVGEVTTAHPASDGFFILPAPTKFVRKSKHLERSASADRTGIAENSTEAQRKYIYTAHRQYVTSLINQTEWVAFERLCEMN
jgi:hypothetical protein